MPVVPPNTTVPVQTQEEIAVDVDTAVGLYDTLVDYSPLGAVLLALGVVAAFVKKKMK